MEQIDEDQNICGIGLMQEDGGRIDPGDVFLFQTAEETPTDKLTYGQVMEWREKAKKYDAVSGTLDILFKWARFELEFDCGDYSTFGTRTRGELRELQERLNVDT